MRVENVLGGLALFGLWFLFWRILLHGTVEYFLMSMVGGVFDPPAIWAFARNLGLVLLPLILFAGAPASIQLIRGRPWVRTALVTAGICTAIWLVLAFIVVLGPSIFGWTW